MSDSIHLHELGKMTVFYVPSHKLDDLRFNENKQSARSSIHEYLMHRYQAYTQTPTPTNPLLQLLFQGYGHLDRPG